MMSQPTTRLVIVHDHQVFRESLTSVLAQQENFAVINVAPSPGETLARVRAYQPDIVLLDISLPDHNAIKLTAEISLELPGVKIIVLGVDEAETTVLKCVEAGASACVLKESSLSDLLETMRAVLRGETICSPRMAYYIFLRVAELARRHRDDQVFESMVLTAREWEILQLISEGLSNKQIAERLYLSVHTVKNHVHKILERLKVSHRSEAVQYAEQKGLLIRSGAALSGLEK